MGLPRKGVPNASRVELVGLPKKDVNLEEHAWRFQFTFPQPPRKYGAPGFVYGRSALPRQKKPPEVRNALREKRIALREKAARHHAEVALTKYNRESNTKVSLSLSVIYIFNGTCSFRFSV